MRIRPLVAAIGAATLVAAGAVVAPAQAATTCDPCEAEINLEAPASIGIGGDWNDAAVTLTNPSDERALVVDDVLLEVSSPEVRVWEGDVALQIEDQGSWLTVLGDEGPAGVEHSLLFETLVLAPGAEHTIDLHVAATMGLLFATIDDTDLTVDLPEPQPVPITLGVTAIGEPVLPGLVDTDEPILATAEAYLEARPLGLDVPSSLDVVIGEPAELTVDITNDTGSNYENVAVFPIAPGLGGPIEDGIPVLRGLERLESADSSRASLRALRDLTEDSTTLVEYSDDGGATWTELDLTGDSELENIFLTIFELAQDVPASRQWRFTLPDESVLEAPTPEEIDLPADGIIWLGVRFGDLDLPPVNLRLADYDDLPPLQPVALDLTRIVLADEQTPTPTPTPTTQPAVDPTDEAPGDDDGAGDDEGAGSGDDDGAGDDEGAGTGELARTGYDLGGQAGAALLLLVLGATAVVTTLRRRSGVHA